MKDFGGKRRCNRPLGRPRRRQNHIRMVLKEMGGEGIKWSDMAQDRDKWRAVVKMVMNLRVP